MHTWLEYLILQATVISTGASTIHGECFSAASERQLHTCRGVSTVQHTLFYFTALFITQKILLVM